MSKLSKSFSKPASSGKSTPVPYNTTAAYRREVRKQGVGKRGFQAGTVMDRRDQLG